MATFTIELSCPSPSSPRVSDWLLDKHYELVEKLRRSKRTQAVIKVWLLTISYLIVAIVGASFLPGAQFIHMEIGACIGLYGIIFFIQMQDRFHLNEYRFPVKHRKNTY